jgi:penicillin-binding protein 1A
MLHPTKGAPWYRTFLKTFGKTYDDRKRALFQGGLQIYTTLRPNMQAEAEAAVASHIPNPGIKQPANPEAALVTIAPQTGAIQAMYGGPNFTKHKINLAVQGQRNAGSSFKAFTLVAALESGIPVGKVYDTPNPVDVPASKCPNNGGDWKPSNAEAGSGGFMDMATATAASVNVYFAQLIADTGPDNVKKAAEDMGVISYADNSHVSIPAVCAITLGSVQVNPLSMTAGYATLANHGVRCYPFAIRKVVQPTGKALFRNKSSCKKAIDPGVAAQVTGLLRGVLTSGTAANSNIPRPAAGKTGTAQNFTDAWFVGYVPQLVTGVWVGYGYPNKEIPMTGAPVLHGLHAFGGTLAAPIWHDFMVKALQGIPVENFPTPPAAKGGTVPNVVGMKQAEAENTLAKANFTADVVEGASTEPKGIVFSQSPGGGASATLGSRVTIKVSNGQAPVSVVPGVVGDKVGVAKTALQSAGFVVSIEYQAVDDQKMDGIVLSQNPAGGKKISEGSTVTIVVGKFDPGPTPSPSPP